MVLGLQLALTAPDDKVNTMTVMCQTLAEKVSEAELKRAMAEALKIMDETTQH
jgi:hypothetical protein